MSHPLTEEILREADKLYTNDSGRIKLRTFLLDSLTRVREDERKYVLTKVYNDMRTILPMQLPPHADYVTVRRVALDSLQDDFNHPLD